MPRPAKAYPVTLVGEQHYAEAVGEARIGDRVALLREAGNPHDAQAIAVVDVEARTLGYIPRGGWLRRALIDEGKGAAAEILNRWDGEAGFVQLSIAVMLTGDGPIDGRAFQPST